MLQYKKYIVLLTVAILFIVQSCRTVTQVKEIPIETIKTEYKDKVIQDSIYFRDSILILQKGDTIYSTQVKYRYVYKNRIDTIIKVDTIPNIVTITNTEVQNRLYNQQKILIVIGLITTLLLISYIVKYLKDNIKF